MIKNIFTGLLVINLVGCAGYADFPQVAQTPAPVNVVGVWMSDGPQKSLVNPAVIASLVVNRAGDTLDCRQWQRTIERRGKLTWRGEQLYNVNVKNEYRKITVTDDKMQYGSLTMRRVAKPTQACQAFVVYANGDYTFTDRPVPTTVPQANTHKQSSVISTNK
ncbi:hypothetical protein SJI19_17110 [Acerihabitans sp. TG2]|uniref:hypothetical protein n=1 Tax=Acerihabitans sp. TG2 TaxID=3096008 RepID=UPI002B23652D|nr:hypothetical protein [Acerihabitans sp. TG2]MEA9392247.1 hypothetical protein [Acerihabitans sp. TG2]